MDLNLCKLWEIVENRRAWRAAVHGFPKNQTQFRDWATITKSLNTAPKLNSKQGSSNFCLDIKISSRYHILCLKTKKTMDGLPSETSQSDHIFNTCFSEIFDNVRGKGRLRQWPGKKLTHRPQVVWLPGQTILVQNLQLENLSTSGFNLGI